MSEKQRGNLTRGGSRKGAGRKPRETALVALTMKLDPELLDAWNARKAELGISGPALLAKFLRWRRRGGGETQRTEAARKIGAWEYSRYRATLTRNGRFFALVTPDGKNALSEEDEMALLDALNGRPNARISDGEGTAT